MVEDQADRTGWPHRMAVEVGKHLLTALQALVHEKDNRDVLIGKVGIFPYRRLDGCSTVLSVVDDEASVHGNMEQADSLRALDTAQGFKAYVSIQGCGQSREHVVIAVLQYVAGHLGDSAFIEHPLGPQLRNQLFLIE